MSNYDAQMPSNLAPIENHKGHPSTIHTPNITILNMADLLEDFATKLNLFSLKPYSLLTMAFN